MPAGPSKNFAPRRALQQMQRVTCSNLNRLQGPTKNANRGFSKRLVLLSSGLVAPTCFVVFVTPVEIDFQGYRPPVPLF